MKTPEEIKKGLECCMAEECFGEKENCPYTADPALCVGVMCEDALAYIQQLEAKVEGLERVRADLTATNMQLSDVVFKNELFKCRLEEERSVFEAQVPRWISVEDRLPEDDEMYLVYTTEHTCAVYRYWGDGEWETEWGEDASHNITHWMPLPVAPKEE